MRSPAGTEQNLLCIGALYYDARSLQQPITWKWRDLSVHDSPQFSAIDTRS